MASEKLMELKPGKGLDSGLYPSVEASAGAIWRTGLNVWFREMAIQHSLGKNRIITTIGRQAKALIQAFTTAGARRLYYDDLGIVNYWEGLAPAAIGAVNVAGDPDFETWGDWLLSTDGVGPVQIWKNTGALVNIPDALTQFSRVKMLRRMAQHILAFNSNVLPTGFHWCSADSPDIWTPSTTNSAGNTDIRNLDSEIVAVEPLGGSLAIYSRETMLLVRYIGPTQWFGTPQQALAGIGAVGRKSVVSLGNLNFGLSRGGIWRTDGNSYAYIDRPAIDTWLQSTVDWDQANTIVGYWDEVQQMIVWSVPVIGGARTAVSLDPKTNAGSILQKEPPRFSYLDLNFSAAVERQIFNYPILALPDGIYFNSMSDRLAGNFSLTSHLQDAGDPSIYKLWDFVFLAGNIAPSSQVRFGFTDEPVTSSIEWLPWQNIISNRVPFGPRESVYIAMELSATEAFKLSSITVAGEKGGQVN